MKVWRVFYKNHKLHEGSEFRTKQYMENKHGSLLRDLKRIDPDYDPALVRRREYDIDYRRKSRVQIFRRVHKGRSALLIKTSYT